ncbi:MAG: hypothetical protein SOR60_07895, partial [Anaerococcus porci]|nr:hypothetical protein [Anaerococcus porci]
EEVKKKIEEANKDKFPEGTKVEVGKDGTATITYPDNSVDTINGSDLVEQKVKATGTEESPKRRSEKSAIKNDYVKKSDNVKTGVGSATGIVATIAAAVSGLFASKKRKNK